MTPPDSFSWIDKPHLAAHSRLGSLEEFQWLRDQGIHLVISLTEDPPQRTWINDAGLFSMHFPVEDMSAPEQEQIDQCVAGIEKANQNGLGVSIHCGAGA